jgi:hypothetical protein
MGNALMNVVILLSCVCAVIIFRYDAKNEDKDEVITYGGFVMFISKWVFVIGLFLASFLGLLYDLGI